MSNVWLAPAARLELRRGWRPLLACAIGIAFGAPLYLYVSSLFMGPLAQNFGWSRAAMGGVMVSIAAAALFMPLVANLVDRFGALRAVACSSVLTCLCYVLLSFMTGALWQYYAGFILVTAIGSAAGPIVYSRVVISWFEKARGLALALMLSGGALGGVIASPIVSAIVTRYGFRAGFVTLGVLCLLGGFSAMAIGLKTGPVNQGERPARKAGGGAVPVPWRQILTRRVFWILAAAIFTMTLAAVGLVAHMQPLFVSRGFSPSTAAWLVSLLAISVLMGRIVTGLLVDRFWAPGVAAGVCLTAATGAALLFAGGDAVPVSVVGILLFGTAQGAELDLLCYIAARYFGMQAYSRVYGALFICFGTALPLGAMGFGMVFDRTGGYAPALGAATGLLLAAGLFYLFLGPYPKQALAAPRGRTEEKAVPA